MYVLTNLTKELNFYPVVFNFLSLNWFDGNLKRKGHKIHLWDLRLSKYIKTRIYKISIIEDCYIYWKIISDLNHKLKVVNDTVKPSCNLVYISSHKVPCQQCFLDFGKVVPLLFDHFPSSMEPKEMYNNKKVYYHESRIWHATAITINKWKWTSNEFKYIKWLNKKSTSKGKRYLVNDYR